MEELRAPEEFRELREGESLDDLQNGYFIIQSESGFRYGMDAVLLSGLYQCAAWRAGCWIWEPEPELFPSFWRPGRPGESFTGLEIQDESACMARRSVAYNGLQDRIRIVTGDIKEARGCFRSGFF